MVVFESWKLVLDYILRSLYHVYRELTSHQKHPTGNFCFDVWVQYQNGHHQDNTPIF